MIKETQDNITDATHHLRKMVAVLESVDTLLEIGEVAEASEEWVKIYDSQKIVTARIGKIRSLMSLLTLTEIPDEIRGGIDEYGV